MFIKYLLGGIYCVPNSHRHNRDDVPSPSLSSVREINQIPASLFHNNGDGDYESEGAENHRRGMVLWVKNTCSASHGLEWGTLTRSGEGWHQGRHPPGKWHLSWLIYGGWVRSVLVTESTRVPWAWRPPPVCSGGWERLGEWGELEN